MITMTDYKTQAMKLAPRLCIKHTELPYSLGCRKCLTCGCVECLSVLGNCTAGMYSIENCADGMCSIENCTDGMYSLEKCTDIMYS